MGAGAGGSELTSSVALCPLGFVKELNQVHWIPEECDRSLSRTQYILRQ